MTKREFILEHIKIASYNGDDKKCMDLFCNNRISRNAYDKAFSLGKKLREKNEEKKSI